MNGRHITRCLICTFALLGSALAASAQEMPPDYAQVLSTLGRQGDFKDKVLKVNIPRNDLKVTVAGIATPDLIGTIVHGSAPGAVTAPAASSTLTTAPLAQIVGQQGDQTGAVYQITLGRGDRTVTEMGATINARMGLNTWAAFTGTDAHAAVAGDIAMLESEVTPALKALRANGIDVVAIHHHMTGERPMIIFLHYWGTGAAGTLARGVNAAVDELGKHGGASR